MSEEDRSPRTRIMLVEDQVDFRRMMVALLDRQPDLEVVAQAGSLAEARGYVTTLRFDVTILDLGLPDGHGADLISDLREGSPGAAVLVLSASLDPKNLERATKAGADGVLDKFATLEEILDTVRWLGGA